MLPRRPQNPDRLPPLLAAATKILVGEVGVRWADLFGSAAEGRAFRDLDLAVMADSELARRGLWLGRLAALLEEALAGVPLDLVDLAAAAPALRAAVVYQGRLLVDRTPMERQRWELETVQRWLDLEPWLARGERLRLQALAQRRP